MYPAQLRPQCGRNGEGAVELAVALQLPPRKPAAKLRLQLRCQALDEATAVGGPVGPVLRFLPADAVRVADYVEVESGRKSARPQLLAAIALAQREDAVLLVAKLDRLARSVAFLATLMESRVRFQAVDLPAADEFTLHILAAVAQKEASAISRACYALMMKFGVWQLLLPTRVT